MGMTYGTKLIAVIGVMVSMAVLAASAAAQGFLVKEGQPQAEIIIAEKPPRTVKLAAEELQGYMEKISGAKLPVATAPTAGVPVQIFLGRSAHTDRLGLSDEGLDYGAFRMKSGENWLALVGRDSDFTPPEPFARNREAIPPMMEKWDALTGEKWSNPVGSRMTRYHNKATGLWENDERGSLNAVYELLRGLGVRWYMPGELGEIVPKVATIELPQVDRVVRPDYAMRYMYFAFFHMASKEDVLWYLRLGLNHGREVIGNAEIGHGSRSVHAREEMKKAHPEYYALWGGKRETDKKGAGVPCLSAEGLIEQNIKYVRAIFDIYNEPMVSVMPQDGYATVCQCNLCEGKGTPQRGWFGGMSDYVWEYAERVAREVYKTHPNKWVSCHAYGTYLLPPEKIDKLSPNVVVGIVYHRPGLNEKDEFERYSAIVNGWREKATSGKIMRWAHYLHSSLRSPYHGLPVYYPRAIARDLKFLKGVSLGDFIEISLDKGTVFAPAYNHLNMYVTSRLYWDAEQDLDALLAEYYEKFYGPAAPEMKAFVDYSEANWPRMTKEAEPINEARKLLDAAQKAAGDSIYGKRIGLLAEYLAPMKGLAERLTKGREGVPEARGLNVERPDIKLDGLLEDSFWARQPTYHLKEVETGRKAQADTTFKIGWEGNSLYFAIRCQEPDMKGLKIGTTKSDDNNIWHGDCVELLLETQCHSYYQIVINPAGAVMDLDRKGGINANWSSGVEAATHQGQDFWSAEVRVSLTGDMRGSPDPLNGVAGGRPTTTHPFFFNVCRQRLREGGDELSAFSPTGKKGFHVLDKFGKLHIR